MNEIASAIIRVIPFIILISVVSLRIKQQKFSLNELGLSKPNKYFMYWLLGFIVFILISEFILYHYDLLEISKWKHGGLASVIRIFGMIILAPVAEELLFRGILLNKLKKKINKAGFAVVIQAFIFVVLHSFAYDNTITSNLGIVLSFIDASIFAIARFHTQSIFTPIAMHSIGNSLATLEMAYL